VGEEKHAKESARSAGPVTPTDGELVPRAIAGDTEALSELLGRHGPAVERSLDINAAWRTVIDPADVMQVTYLEAFMQVGRLADSDPNTFVSWLRRIAHNNLRDAIRGLEREKRPQPHQRVQASHFEDSLTDLCNLLGATSTTPSREVNRNELVGLMRTAIDALPRSYADVIRLYDLEGQPIAEVARHLQRSPGAVHMLRARAHDQLRHQLGWTSVGI
jgi:RNA polymerase sigma-70 factor (ECF subfamily)